MFGGLILSPALIHLALFHSHSHALPFALLLVQLGIVWFLFSGRLRPRNRALLGVAMFVLLGILAWAFGSASVAASTGLTHAAVQISLLAAFGSTLAPGREPLVTQIVRKARTTPPPPEMLSYARFVTQLWCGFFILQLVISLVLLIAAPLPVWSFFINVLAVPLVIALFLLEFAYHTWRFRHLPRSKFADLVRVSSAMRSGSAKKPAAS
jgi:uncharacterized membrane protein